jgi:glucuronoarabinoxylan endo-1,4-beta-xylanase
MMRFPKKFVFLSAALAILGCSSGNNTTQTEPPITPGISWASPAAITYGTALSSAQLDASTDGVAGTFVYSPAAGTILPAGNQTLAVTFMPADTTKYTSANAIATLTVNKATPNITWTPAALIAGSALGSSQLDASSGGVAGSFAYTPTAGTVESTAGSATLSVTFTPTDTTDYAVANDSATLTVLSADAAAVDFGSSVQTIRGFGGSTAWMPELTSEQANTLFGTGENQLGLSILRVRIDPSTVTGGSSNWGTELANAKAAQAAGSDVIVFATPWTPPAAWKTNTQGVLYNNSPPNSNGTDALWGGSLNTADYANYASYLESFVTYMANNGVNLYGISMQNEPDVNVSYESCVWTGAQMDTWVANNSSALTTKLIMPESESFATSYSDPALNDVNAVGNISIIAGHLYGASPSYYTNAKNKGKDVWMTEHYLTPSGAQPGIADALAVAKEINDSMSVADYNAYLWWWVIDWNPGAGVTNTGLVDQNNNPTYYGYAMAQYAKFVRPGYVRANSTYNPGSGNVYVTAYEGDGHYVIVAINMGTAAQSQPFLIQNQTVATLTPYQTSASESMEQLSPVAVTSNAFTYILPAQSITTFVQ